MASNNKMDAKLGDLSKNLSQGTESNAPVANAASNVSKSAEDFVSSEGGDTPPAAANRNTQSHPDKMEDDLTMSKENKQSTDGAEDVAGRKGKGMGLVDKLVPGK
ncbi:hypothetical protein LTR66_003385 [Elasticomyces elasticus]|nr:hypothetical protein LTR50_002626 [Elasticomyces elasticus]KAK4997161.1 hypothetical protein LTR66_003385 [Elasticomyces elasticus]